MGGGRSLLNLGRMQFVSQCRLARLDGRKVRSITR